MNKPTQSDYEDLMTRLSKASLDVKEAIREAHQTSRDLKAQVRDAKEALSNKAVEAVIGALLAEQLKSMGDSVREYTQQAHDKVLQEFDKLTKPLMASIDEIHDHLKQLDVEVANRSRMYNEM